MKTKTQKRVRILRGLSVLLVYGFFAWIYIPESEYLEGIESFVARLMLVVGVAVLAVLLVEMIVLVTRRKENEDITPSTPGTSSVVLVLIGLIVLATRRNRK